MLPFGGKRGSRQLRGEEGRPVRAYLIQNLKSDRGETESARLISPRGGDVRVMETADTELTLRPEAGVVYECGEVTDLTLSSFPEKGSFMVVFTSGAAAATLTVPQTLIMPASFQVEANTRYEIHVRDGFALCAGWAVSGS